ncbi:MAG: hypothetical protein ACRD44_13895 [Bryobacteraceae bacterium]
MKTTRRTVLGLPFAAVPSRAAADWDVGVEQVTHGPKHHFFGYIGHVKNTPWNHSGRYMAVLRTSFQDHRPAPAEAAEVVLIDTLRNNEIDVIDQCRAWNPQQGTMLYWNPRAGDTQLLFNDRDLATNRVFAVLYDIGRRRRVREFRFDDTPVGNSGVAQNGGHFLAINYGRLARLRPVTGYAAAHDWNPAMAAPDNDGIFLVEIATGRKRLLISFRQIAAQIITVRPDVEGKHLFINHTLWNRDDNRIFFFVRGVRSGIWDNNQERVDIPCTIRPDGTGLTVHEYMGGHPEWEFGPRLIGAAGGRQVLYDVDEKRITGEIGTPGILPRPGGDVALSFDGKWFVNGYREGRENRYAILRRSDGVHTLTTGLPVDQWTGGELRIDPSPCWNRTGDMIAVPAIAADAARTRQTFVLKIRKR